MKKTTLLKSMLLLCALVVGSGSVWADTTVSMDSFDAISGYVDGDDNVSYAAAKGSAGTAPVVNSSEIRVYQNGGTFTITANNGCKIKSITLGSSMVTTVTYSVDGGAASTNQNISAGGTTTVSDLNCSSVLFTCTGTDKNHRLYVNYLSVTYSGGSSVSKPVFSVATGSAVERGSTVTLTTATVGATIYYTKGADPADPTASSTKYTEAITIDEATTIKAIAILGAVSSAVETASYTIKKVATPTFSVADGSTVVSGTTIELATATDGATIHYTTDGSTPTSSSTTYSSAITIDANKTIKAIAVKANCDDSDVASATYTVAEPVPGLSIDFEVASLSQYTDWEFDNIGIHTNITGVSAHSGTHWGSNVNPSTDAGVSSASITTANKIANPATLTFYASKESDNTTTSSWKVQYSSNGSTWNDYETFDARGMSKGSWTMFSANLSSQTNVFIRLYYTGSTAKRAVDDITLAIGPADPTTSGNETYLTTSDNMDGWRAFYDDDYSYSVDGNTKVYVADAGPSAGVITLKKIDGIPAKVPVILHTSSSADSHKMTLTKETVSPYSYTEDNYLKWTTSAVSNKYRLGYGASGVGFYPYTGTPSSGAVILNIDVSAPALTIDFEESDVTGIAEVSTKKEFNGEYFNLAGQRIAQPTKGLYIVNGKKVVIK